MSHSLIDHVQSIAPIKPPSLPFRLFHFLFFWYNTWLSTLTQPSLLYSNVCLHQLKHCQCVSLLFNLNDGEFRTPQWILAIDQNERSNLSINLKSSNPSYRMLTPLIVHYILPVLCVSQLVCEQDRVEPVLFGSFCLPPIEPPLVRCISLHTTVKIAGRCLCFDHFVCWRRRVISINSAWRSTSSVITLYCHILKKIEDTDDTVCDTLLSSSCIQWRSLNTNTFVVLRFSDDLNSIV